MRPKTEEETRVGSAEAAAQKVANILGVRPGQLIQEIGWDEDCDSDISVAIEDAIDDDLLGEDTLEICDVVVLWWRNGDGDLVDALVDALRNLDESGCIWVLSPGASQSNALQPGEVAESAQLAGLVQTRNERLNSWQGSCLVRGGKNVRG
ncbi:DUF3052 domain-containing protein [Corynebacterium argentoratense]|jgi:hypothetical protein|uniref:DUF3052 domain-containing protein n=1 Tax=Corynebacterium argentoratense TaxID=42817 RepID=UPI001F195CA6|nr:DUF3052 domain-containing protein [Corynebacterium argentoratense]MCF1693486.1 DUF3052 domain-containing protein [Corynebacterium argentoratense]MCF1712542.1 DUF3052 domain-containing protein [Corynebacterium argentoratense]MCF1734784.1 DUF3052 domain-containing protein [Corynebacterium argentoratense]